MGREINNSDLELIFNHYKFNAQIQKLAEEASELAKACVKLDDNNMNLLEGIADVEVVIEQFKNHYPNWVEKIEDIKVRKINLVLSKIEEECK